MPVLGEIFYLIYPIESLQDFHGVCTVNSIFQARKLRGSPSFLSCSSGPAGNQTKVRLISRTLMPPADD